MTCPSRTRLDPVARGARDGPREAAGRGGRRSSARDWSLGVAAATGWPEEAAVGGADRGGQPRAGGAGE